MSSERLQLRRLNYEYDIGGGNAPNFLLNTRIAISNFVKYSAFSEGGIYRLIPPELVNVDTYNRFFVYAVRNN